MASALTELSIAGPACEAKPHGASPCSCSRWSYVIPGACTGAIQDRRSCRKAVESFLEMLSAASDMFFPKGSVPLPISLQHGSVLRWQGGKGLCR